MSLDTTKTVESVTYNGVAFPLKGGGATTASEVSYTNVNLVLQMHKAHLMRWLVRKLKPRLISRLLAAPLIRWTGKSRTTQRVFLHSHRIRRHLRKMLILLMRRHIRTQTKTY